MTSDLQRIPFDNWIDIFEFIESEHRHATLAMLLRLSSSFRSCFVEFLDRANDDDDAANAFLGLIFFK
jgi:hypothetical protein